MLETDADRLEIIRALGGISARVDGKTISAIFENEYEAAQLADGVVQASTPNLRARTSDIPSVTTRSIVEMGEQVYAVLTVEPDGTGMTLLRLELQ